MKKQQYSVAKKATALTILASNQGNIYRTAKQVGIPIRTLRGWKSGVGISDAVIKKCEEKKKDLASELEDKAFLLIDHIDYEHAQRSSLPQITSAVETILDRVQALRSKAADPDDGNTPKRKIIVEYVNREPPKPYGEI